MEPDLPDPEILFSRVCTPGVLYTHSPCLLPREFFWDVCWPTILRTHGIGLAVVFSYGISPIKESTVTWLCVVLYYIENNLCDCVREIVRV